ncbi:MAG: DnaD domain protein [Chloroflexi bacterium]|nr:DnaD domain protein [Chloroflexota bacterium]
MNKSVFGGFTEIGGQGAALPEQFFRELLPLLDDLGEVKLILYALWLLEHKDGAFRALRCADFSADARLSAAIGGEAAIDLALERAAAHGALLAVEDGETGEKLYFVNSPRGQAAVQAILSGGWQAQEAPGGDSLPPEAQTNIFSLYEEVIGPLTPRVADELAEAEKTYPADWIVEAIGLAKKKNIRNWRYARAILERWRVEGRNERKDRQDPEKARRRFVEGEFADFVEH